MKVYSWIDMKPHGLDVPRVSGYSNQQVRWVVAARSRRAAMLAAGYAPVSAFVRDYVGETGHTPSVAIALSAPGVPFVSELHSRADTVYVAVPPEKIGEGKR
jgi:hypothetical protein